MNKKLIGSMLLAAMLIWSAQALSDEQSESVESPETSATEQASTSEGAESLPSGQGWRVVRIVEIAKTGKFVHMVLIDRDKEMDKSVYGAAIHRLCSKATDFCRIRFWTQERLIPEKVTLTHEQLKGQKAEYLFNQSAGIRQTTWSCDVEHDRSQCISY